MPQLQDMRDMRDTVVMRDIKYDIKQNQGNDPTGCGNPNGAHSDAAGAYISFPDISSPVNHSYDDIVLVEKFRTACYEFGPQVMLNLTMVHCAVSQLRSAHERHQSQG
jgi:hypothetical protein